MTTFSGLEIGKKGMLTHQVAISVMGNNVSKMNAEGYSRRRVRIVSDRPLDIPSLSREHVAGHLGHGSVISKVERMFDTIHENQVISTADGLGYWDVRNFYMQKIQAIYAEPNEVSLRDSMDKFWLSWQDLSVNPESLAHRSVVVEQGFDLTESIRSTYERLHEQRSLLNDHIRVTVNEINDKIKRIASVNNEIVISKASGNDPNDFLDMRDQLVRELAQLMPVTVEHRDMDEFQVHVRGRTLVQGDLFIPLNILEKKDDPGMIDLEWDEKNTQRLYTEESGKLFALIELRDTDLKQEIQKINTFAASLSDMTNALHSLGISRDGSQGVEFFTQIPIIEDVAGNYDSNGDGQFDSTYLFRITGTNRLSLTTPVGIGGVMSFDGNFGRVEVNYDPSDTVEQIIQRINYTDSGIVVHLDSQGYLNLRAVTEFGNTNQKPDLVIPHVEDSGHFLVGYAGILRNLGEEGAYDYTRVNAAQDALRIEQGVNYAVSPLVNPAAWITVNPRLAKDVNKVVASFSLPTGGATFGNNTVALAIADLRHAKVMVDKMTTFDDFFADNVLLIGVKGSNARDSFTDFKDRMKNLNDISQSISGVNITKEFTDLIKFQHGFSASARFVNEINKMLDTIVNRLGS